MISHIHKETTVIIECDSHFNYRQRNMLVKAIFVIGFVLSVNENVIFVVFAAVFVSFFFCDASYSSTTKYIETKDNRIKPNTTKTIMSQRMQSTTSQPLKTKL